MGADSELEHLLYLNKHLHPQAQHIAVSSDIKGHLLFSFTALSILILGTPEIKVQ